MDKLKSKEAIEFMHQQTSKHKQCQEHEFCNFAHLYMLNPDVIVSDKRFKQAADNWMANYSRRERPNQASLRPFCHRAK